ncbi:MAG: fibronectin type III domain-containing protein [Chitinophagaceae bacterium]|nr:fibronectin type III domain-containing protein [Chitinophagaceae bacterium]
MNQFVHKLLGGVFSLFLLFFGVSLVKGQTVFNPNDPIVVYDPAHPPAQPPSGQPGKWVKTNKVTWNTTSFKCYIYKGVAFRLKYPKTYVPGNGKTYPLYLFFHGGGETGTLYDNEFQLYHGGQKHMNAVDNGTFDGFLLYPQVSWNSKVFSLNQRNAIRDLIENFLVPQVQVDPFRVVVNGLSGGGGATWNFLFENPTLVAAAAPISAASITGNAQLVQQSFTPIWLFQGALDTKPPPVNARGMNNAAKAAGNNFKYTEFPDRGHDCWNQSWGQADYFPFLKRAHKANPWALFGRTEFCTEETINVTIGVTAGFDAYEWRKNDEIIIGATSNTIVATSVGKYDCRIRKGSTWSPWSPIPVEIKYKSAVIAPEIELGEFSSKVLPSPDGRTTIKLALPEGYMSYRWEAVGATGAVSTTNTYEAAPGTYKARVSEAVGCNSPFSTPFKVVNSDGANSPDPAAGLVLSKESKTSLRLNWTTNPSPLHPPINFEIYQAQKAGGPYKFVGITDASVLTFTKDGLTPGVKYYFVVRAVNNNGAAALSNEASATTDIDKEPPTAPTDLVLVGTTRNSVSLQWTESDDEVGVEKYDIYINGVKSYTSTNAEYTIYNLEANTQYTFSVKARDFAGNESPASNQITAQTILKGIRYKYYLGTWDLLPDFNALVPTKTGFVPNVTLAPKTQAEYFAFLWEGHIRIPVSGDYIFRTSSDDGSKLYIGAPYSAGAAALVNNDGLHGTVSAEDTINLSAGIYPITITYFQKTGGAVMNVLWKTPQTSSYVNLPDSVFVDPAAPGGGVAPNAPTALSAVAQSYNRINLSWTDNSNNETAFELFRSENAIDGFQTIAVLGPNTTSYPDTTVLSLTKYYYKIRAINQYGQSAFDKSGRGVDYSYYETNTLTALPNFNSLMPVKTGRVGTFSLGMEDRNDNFAMKFDGKITIPAAGQYTFYITSNEGAKLYIGGFSETNLVVNYDGIHSTNEKSGTKTFNASAGPYPITVPITVTYFEANEASEVLSVSYKGPNGSGINKQVIPTNILGEEPASATTMATPPAPEAPTGLDAFGYSSSIIKLVWVDNAAGAATRYELYRSYGDNENFLLYTVLPGNSASYTDTALYPNSLFYYKVKAVGIGGESAYSNEDSARTSGAIPVLDVIENQYMRFNSQLQVPVKAVNGTADAISIFVDNLPVFGSFSTTGNGEGVITFNPTEVQQGVYTNIIVKAVNPQNDTATVTFNLVVNNNYLPVIPPIANVTLNERDTVVVNISATDTDEGDQLLWSFLNLPDFVNVAINNRSLTFTIAPNYSHAGTYKPLVRIEDGRNGKDTVSFLIKVNPTPIVPERIFVNFTDGNGSFAGPGAGSKWNNTNSAPSQNATFSSLKTDAGAISSVSIKILDAGFSSSNTGMNTGNNSGIYPDSVIRSQYRVGANAKNMRISGLDVNRRYSFTFFGSHNANDRDYITVYTMKGQSVSLNARANSQNTVSIVNIAPDAGGILNLNVARSSSVAPYGYLNAMVIETVFEDSTAPARVKNLVANFEDDVIKLTWTNVAYNAIAYEVYRATSLMGPYVLLNPGVISDTLQSYTDETVVGSKTYYYMVRCRNNFGGSTSQVVKVITPNKAPVFTGTNEFFVKTDQTVSVSITTTDDIADIVTLSAANLPSFVTFTDNGGGLGTLQISPAQANIGAFRNILLTATDNYGASTVNNISINVTDKNTSSIYVNFNASNPVDGIWNNFNKAPTANAAISDLKNDIGTITGAGVTLLDAWQGGNVTGAISGNNSGIYRDSVLRTVFYEGRGNTNRVRITGLSTDPNKRYSLVFVASVDAVGNRNTLFTAGGKSVTLNAANNTDRSVQINDLVPAAGVIEFTVGRGSGSSNSYINTLVIQEYTVSATLLSPVNLRGKAVAKDSIMLTWDNRTDGGTYEIYRAESSGGSYSLAGTATSNTFTDGGLLKNKEYFYKVRSVVGINTSDYSNIAVVSTFAYSVYINFNRDNPASWPWNNTNGDPVEDDVLADLRNDEGNYSGVDITVGAGFSAVNNSGENTGNNSGVVPDNVMRSTWWVDIGQVAQLKVSGLSQNMSYRFLFFASRTGTTTRIVNYSINGRIAKLKANQNTSETITIDEVYADSNGEVLIIIYGETGSFGYIGGLVISGAKRSSNPVEGGGAAFRTGRNDAPKAQEEMIVAPESGNNTIAAYPNPFVDDVTIKLSLKQEAKAIIKVLDMNGKVVMVKDIGNVPKGTWQYTLGLNNKGYLPQGVYFIQVQGLGLNFRPLKVLKTR